MTREEKVAEAFRLRGDGLLQREIAARMGVKLSTVNSWLTDPDGSRHKARKQSYVGSCEDCGAPTNGYAGKGKACRLCRECELRHRHEDAKWTTQSIVASIQRFEQRHGRVPSANDFNPAMARSVGDLAASERFYRDGDYPHASMVQRIFGSWTAGVRAAGFEPRLRRYVGDRPETKAMVLDRYRAGVSARRIAMALGCSEEFVRKVAIEAGIHRTHAEALALLRNAA